MYDTTNGTAVNTTLSYDEVETYCSNNINTVNSSNAWLLGGGAESYPNSIYEFNICSHVYVRT